MIFNFILLVISLAAIWVAYHIGYMDGARATFNKRAEGKQ